MADITLTYKGNTIGEVSASGSHTINTAGYYCDADIELVYVKSGGGGDEPALGTKSISENGTYYASNDELDGYSSVTVNVTSGGTELAGYLSKTWPSGEVTITGADKIPGGAFLLNTSITSVTSSSVTKIGESSSSSVALNIGAFQNCTNLTSVSFPNVTYLGFNAFQNCTKLTSVSFPALTTMGISGSRASNTFAGCSALQLIHLPELTYINGTFSLGSIGTASTKVTIVLPKLAGTAPSFRASKCAAVDLGPGVTDIPSDAIYNTTTMDVLILRRTDGVVSAANSDAILGITTNSAVYVPRNLIESYQQASIWSTKDSSIFHAIEDSIYETAYADGTPISTT